MVKINLETKAVDTGNLNVKILNCLYLPLKFHNQHFIIKYNFNNILKLNASNKRLRLEIALKNSLLLEHNI